MNRIVFQHRATSLRFGAPRIACAEHLEARRLLSEYHVSPDGNDASVGTPQAPWRTLQHAADRVEAGDTVVVRAGHYTGFDLRTSGAETKRIRFVAQGGTVIDERNARTPDGINLEGASYVTIQGFTVRNAPRAGIRSVANTGVDIVANECDSNGTWGILTGFSDRVLIEENVVSRSVEQHGIYVGNSADNPIIRGNTVWGNRQCGIHVNADAEQGGDGIITGAIIENNTIYSNGFGGGSAINLDGVQKSAIRNNVLYDNHSSGISLFRRDGAESSIDNDIFNNTIVMANDKRSPGRFALNIKYHSTGNTVRNNVLFSYYPRADAGGSIAIADDSLPGFSSDYNIVNDSHTFERHGRQMRLNEWQIDTGNDAHSQNVQSLSELFVDAPNHNYRLKNGGVGIDAGIAIKNIRRDIVSEARPSGDAIDVGAYEFQQYAAPRDVRARAVSNDQVQLTWKDSANGAAKFAVYRRGANEKYVRVALVSAGRTDWMDATVQPNRIYAYKIVAYSEAGWGDNSDPVSVLVPLN